jgi:hypothetical protein
MAQLFVKIPSTRIFLTEGNEGNQVRPKPQQFSIFDCGLAIAAFYGLPNGAWGRSN